MEEYLTSKHSKLELSMPMEHKEMEIPMVVTA